MATTIKLKNSVTTTNAPSSLVQGEVAINITDKKVWVGNAATTPIQLLGDGGSASFTSIAFGAGTVSNPSITFTGDTNTGIYSPAADTIAFTEGGVESMRITSSAELLVGLTTRVTGLSGVTQLEVSGANGGITINSTDTGASNFCRLVFTKSGATGNEGVIRYNTNNYHMAFWTNALERMRIDGSGMVGINTDAPNGRLTIGANASDTALSGTSNTQGLHLYARTFGISQIDSLVSGGSNSGMSLRTYNNGTYTEFIANDQGNTTRFQTAGSERMRIDSSGRLLIGGTSTYDFNGQANLVVNGTSNLSTICIASTSSGYLAFADGTTGNDRLAGIIEYGHGSDFMGFRTAATERMRITSGGNVLIGTTATSGNGKFTNALDSATIARFSDASNQLVFSRIQVTNASNNATVDAFRFLDADGNINGAGRVAGHIYLTANGASGANAFSAVYYLLTTSNGTLQATFTAIASQVRGTNPISSVQIADDGAGGAVKITVTYINNSGVVTGGVTRVSFVGMLA